MIWHKWNECGLNYTDDKDARVLFWERTRRINVLWNGNLVHKIEGLELFSCKYPGEGWPLRSPSERNWARLLVLVRRSGQNRPPKHHLGFFPFYNLSSKMEPVQHYALFCSDLSDTNAGCPFWHHSALLSEASTSCTPVPGRPQGGRPALSIRPDLIK